MMELSQGLSQSADSREIPVDRVVVGMATLLDAEQVVKLPELVALWGDRLTCRITYVRYKPQTNCLIAYAIGGRDGETYLCYAKCFTSEEYEVAAHKAEHHRWVESEGLPPALALPGLRTMIYLYPNDTHLDGLRIMATPKKIQRALYAHDSDFPEDCWRISDRRLKITAVRYKPERRAVLRLQTRAVHRETGEKKPVEAYMSIFTDDRGRDIFTVMNELHAFLKDIAGTASPRPYAYVADRSALLVEGLPGAPVVPGHPEFDHSVVARTARALAAVHEWDGGSLPVHTATEVIDRAGATAAMLGQIAPDVKTAAREIAGELTRRAAELTSGPVRFVHGDFYHGQILFGGPQVALVDFERSYRGDPAADVGNYCAHLRLAGLDGQLEDDAALVSTFVHEYRLAAPSELTASALRFWTAAGLFFLAVRPFRTLEPDWRRKIGRVLQVCTELLG